MTYQEFINNILETRGRFGIPKGEYKERHHIVPKCIGGTNDEDNLIDLYAKEHFIAHKLLAEENQDNYKLVYAWVAMVYPKPWQYKDKRNYEITAEEYEELKHLQSNVASKTLSESRKGKHPWNYRKTGVYSAETLKKIGDASRGRGEAWKNTAVDSEGYKMSKEARERISKLAIGNRTTAGKNSAKSRKGKHYYTDGNIIKMYIDGTQPDGWIKTNASKANGKKWYNNGIKNKFCFECPDGFDEGMLKKKINNGKE